MHELAITQSVVDMVVDRTAGRRIATVQVQVGELSGVVPDAMLFCYELVTAGTDLEGSAWRSSARRGGPLPRPAAATSSLGT